jgi:aromatic-L-amino-acid decarboxylase
MTPDAFRRHGYAVIDWIAGYMERVEAYPVLSQARPGQIRAGLPADPPQQGEPFEAILADVERLDYARRHPLAVAQLLRLLPGQQLRPGHPGRPAVVWAGGAGHAVATSPAAPNWKPTCWTGWWTCWACRARSNPARPAAA